MPISITFPASSLILLAFGLKLLVSLSLVRDLGLLYLVEPPCTAYLHHVLLCFDSLTHASLPCFRYVLPCSYSYYPSYESELLYCIPTTEVQSYTYYYGNRNEIATDKNQSGNQE